MQLVAYGAQDIYLTGNPQITFFKVVYRRHTNFSMEAIEQTWNGSTTTSGRCTATISRNGDLVHRMYLEVGTNLGSTGAAANPGGAMIKSVELEIGGQKIDKHSGVWMETWAELTQINPSGTVALKVDNTATAATGGGTRFQNSTGMGGVMLLADADATATEIYRVPLQFWFCRNPGLALPLIALQYHEVKIILDHSITTIFPTGAFNRLWCDYIYLDTDERRRFAQVSHEYLIEQVQEQSITSNSTTQDLNFNHPVKELIWTATATGATAGSLLGTSLVLPVASRDDTIILKLNGHDRFAARAHTYFSRTQCLEHHTGSGLNSETASTAAVSAFNDSIGVYSFALKPEEHQPSGTCNFSRIDNAQLNCTTFATAEVYCFAVNYNVLRIMSGMGGLAYSN